MNFMDIPALLIPILTLIFIIENATLRSMVDKEKLEKLETIRHIDNCICLVALTFLICDIVQTLSISIGDTWIYTVIGLIVGVAVGLFITNLIIKYLQKKVK